MNDLLLNSHISYAGVEKIDGKLMATGGRVLVCVGFGKTIKKQEIELMLYVVKYMFAGKNVDQILHIKL